MLTTKLTITGQTINGKDIEVSTQSPRMVKYISKSLKSQGVKGEFPISVELAFYKDDDDVLQFSRHDGTEWGSAQYLTFNLMSVTAEEVVKDSVFDDWI